MPTMLTLTALLPLLLGAAPSPDRSPVLLRKTSLLPPYQSAGSGLAPEVKLKVELDRRGYPATVEVLDVKPSSELDEVFREHTLEQIRTWRWSPAIEDGEAVPATLSWTVQYVVRDGTITAGEAAPSRSLELQETFDRRLYLHGLATDKKKGILRNYADVAEQYIDPVNRRHYVSDRFIVVTDAPNKDTARVVALNLEAAFQAVRDALLPEIEPLPHGLKTLVFLYASRSSFTAMRQALRIYTFDDATYYPPGLIAYHLEPSPKQDLLSLLIHEASHAYSDHHLRPAGVVFPRWFEEGFAEYMGNSRIKDGQLEPGKLQKRRFVMRFNHFAKAGRLEKTAAGYDLTELKKKARSGDALSLRQIVDATREEFHGSGFPLYYGSSWLFVHFLRHGRPEWQDGRFSKLVLYLSSGFDDEAAIQDVYGHSIDELEQPFLDYMKKI